MHLSVCIYICREREREKKREKERKRVRGTLTLFTRSHQHSGDALCMRTERMTQCLHKCSIKASTHRCYDGLTSPGIAMSLCPLRARMKTFI